MPLVIKAFLLSFLLLLGFSSDALAQVVINEFASWETSGDWLELYAFENTDISGWIIRDTASSKVDTILDGTVIGPSSNSYYVVEAGNLLNKSGDVIKLYREDDTTLIDQLSYGNQGGVCIPASGQSAGRYPDANNTIERFSTPTKKTSNNSATLAPCPTPTPTPTVTPQPTSTPRPTSTPKPTPTIKKTPTPKPTIKAVATKKVVPTQSSFAIKPGEDSDEVILGLRNQLSITPTESPGEESNRKFPLLAILMIVGGISFMGAAGYPFIKDKIKRYNIK